MDTAKFHNGQVVRDTVTGYEGMIVATTLWLNGCYRYVVQPQKLHPETGEPIKDCSFDEHQLVLVTPAVREGKHDTGGPRPHVSQRSLTR